MLLTLAAWTAFAGVHLVSPGPIITDGSPVTLSFFVDDPRVDERIRIRPSRGNRRHLEESGPGIFNFRFVPPNVDEPTTISVSVVRGGQEEVFAIDLVPGWEADIALDVQPVAGGFDVLLSPENAGPQQVMDHRFLMTASSGEFAEPVSNGDGTYTAHYVPDPEGPTSVLLSVADAAAPDLRHGWTQLFLSGEPGVLSVFLGLPDTALADPERSIPIRVVTTAGIAPTIRASGGLVSTPKPTSEQGVYLAKYTPLDRPGPVTISTLDHTATIELVAPMLRVQPYSTQMDDGNVNVQLRTRDHRGISRRDRLILDATQARRLSRSTRDGVTEVTYRPRGPSVVVAKPEMRTGGKHPKEIVVRVPLGSETGGTLSALVAVVDRYGSPIPHQRVDLGTQRDAWAPAFVDTGVDGVAIVRLKAGSEVGMVELTAHAQGLKDATSFYQGAAVVLPPSGDRTTLSALEALSGSVPIVILRSGEVQLVTEPLVVVKAPKGKIVHRMRYRPYVRAGLGVLAGETAMMGPRFGTGIRIELDHWELDISGGNYTYTSTSNTIETPLGPVTTPAMGYNSGWARIGGLVSILPRGAHTPYGGIALSYGTTVAMTGSQLAMGSAFPFQESPSARRVGTTTRRLNRLDQTYPSYSGIESGNHRIGKPDRPDTHRARLTKNATAGPLI